jgi:hypothetical protein
MMVSLQLVRSRRSRVGTILKVMNNSKKALSKLLSRKGVKLLGIGKVLTHGWNIVADRFGYGRRGCQPGTTPESGT